MPAIADATNASERNKLIAALREAHPEIHAEFISALRQADGERAFLSNSGRYPLCGRGRVNTYAVFAEADRSLLGPAGRLGVILPAGIATDATTQYFFKNLVSSKTLASLLHFENEAFIFPSVHHAFKFCLLTITGTTTPTSTAEFAFYARHVEDLARPDAVFTLTPEEIILLNPNTGTCPVFRSRRDAEIAIGIYKRVPVLIDEGNANSNPWGIYFRQGLFNMANDSNLFRTGDQLKSVGAELEGNIWYAGARTWLPLYEAKMAHHFNHRWGDYATKEASDRGSALLDVPEDQLADPSFAPQPRYWVDGNEVESQLPGWPQDWLVGFRDITNTTNERTAIIAIIPRFGVGHTLPLMFPAVDPTHVASLVANLTSFVFDYETRQKLGGTHLTYFILKQLPVLSPDRYDQQVPWNPTITLNRWLAPRVLELTYTAWDMRGFAVDLGDNAPPFRLDPERRPLMRAELDAAFFHLYGLDRDEADYIMGTFPVVKERDEKRFGEYRTKRLILEAYDAMAQAIETGEPFVSSLAPPPGKGPRHPARAAMPARVETDRKTVRLGSTGCGHNPDLGGGTPECQVCAFNHRRTS